MTDPTNHPQGAEETYRTVCSKIGFGYYVNPALMSNEDCIEAAKAAMHTHTEDWLKYFVERVKVQPFTLTHDDLDSLLSEVTAKMKEGSK